ncbi:MAG: baseplate J/gp47 family protein [Lachnospiraceae bacterium]|nr:baseplate J/gp47 family protein [Lachnospiraceae bacterium]
MLKVEELTNRTYEERIAEAITELPLFSSEWTNYNASDPGITILENLTAFETVQGEDITDLSYRAKMAILKLVGFTTKKGKCARVLLSPSTGGRRIHINSGEKFHLGSLCFETNKAVDVGDCALTAVYSKTDEGFKDISYVIDRELRLAAKLFSKKPKEGEGLYFIADNIPENLTDTCFYIQLEETVNRNPIEDRTRNVFSSLKWEVYTDTGFEEIKVWDYTASLLTSGEVRLRFPEGRMAVFEETPVHGYCIRATLTKAAFDIRPRLMAVEGFLFEAWQKETLSVCHTIGKTENIAVRSPFNGEDYLLIFGKEEKGSSYRRYLLGAPGLSAGRYCSYEELDDHYYSIKFDKETYGFEPIHTKDCVRVIMYSERIMKQYELGQVVGYDNQGIDLPVDHIVPDSFCLIARRTDENGEYYYDFVRPEKKGEDNLYFHLLENDGKIIIEDAGAFIGADLFMGSVAVFDGEMGNIMEYNTLTADHLSDDITFFNPGAGTGGAYRENMNKVKKRFITDMQTPYTLVTEKDYEQIVLSTPGLCIRKAHAVMHEDENLVRVAVMPATDEENPTLSEIYKDIISDRLEERRLITTRFQIVQPVYARVSVRSTVYVKRHFSNYREEIERVLKRHVDYIESNRNFGEVLRFEDVFHAIEDLECVEFVYELSLRSENPKYAILRETDIYPIENCLLTMGDVQLEIVTYDK